MRTNLGPRIRQLIQQEGPMTVQEISAATGAKQSNVYRALHGMPDAFILKWRLHAEMRRHIEVWDVFMKKHAPRPCVTP